MVVFVGRGWRGGRRRSPARGLSVTRRWLPSPRGFRLQNGTSWLAPSNIECQEMLFCSAAYFPTLWFYGKAFTYFINQTCYYRLTVPTTWTQIVWTKKPKMLVSWLTLNPSFEYSFDLKFVDILYTILNPILLSSCYEMYIENPITLF